MVASKAALLADLSVASMAEWRDVVMVVLMVALWVVKMVA